jgi:hypothetical protein
MEHDGDDSHKDCKGNLIQRMCLEVKGDTKKTGTFEKPNKNCRNPTKKFY